MNEQMKQKMNGGEIYDPGDEEVMKEQLGYCDKMYDFNMTRPSEMERRMELMKEIMGDVGENCYIEPPLHSNWGGKHLHLGDGVYANFNLTVVDDTDVYIGSHTMIGPNVTLATAGHPIWPSLREKGLQYNLPIHIGENCWLGAGVIVLPGITIGNNVVIGAGSVVTKDLPDNVIAVGNPCRIIRNVGEHDKKYYYKDKEINWDEFKDFE